MVYGHEKRRSIVWQEMNLHMILRRFIVVRAGCRMLRVVKHRTIDCKIKIINIVHMYRYGSFDNAVDPV